MASKKFGAELLFEDDESGGIITDLLDGGVAQRMKLHENDRVMEVQCGSNDFIFNSSEDAEKLHLEQGKKVSVLFKKDSDDNRLHRNTLVVTKYSAPAAGQACYQLDGTDFTTQLIEQ